MKAYYNPVGNNDREEMLESIYWLNAALEAGLEVEIGNPKSNEPHIILPASGWRKFSDFSKPSREEFSAVVNGMIDTATFKRHANREMIPVDMDIEAIISAAQSLGVERVFIKDQSHQKRSFRFICRPNQSEIRGNIGWFSVQYDGDKRCVLVSEAVTMLSECRFIVIDHKVVCGSRQITSYTPIENLDAQKFYNVPEAMQESASTIAREFGLERPEATHYTLDLCLINDRPSIVEINPPINYGLFACHPKLIIAAMLPLINGGRV